MSRAEIELLTKIALGTAEANDFRAVTYEFKTLHKFLDQNAVDEILKPFDVCVGFDRYEREDDKGNLYWQEMIDIGRMSILGGEGILWRIFGPYNDPSDLGYDVTSGEEWK